MLRTRIAALLVGAALIVAGILGQASAANAANAASAASPPLPGVGYQIFVQNAAGTLIVLDVYATDSVENIKTKTEMFLAVAPSEQRLYYEGRLLADGKTLEDYDVQPETIIHLVAPVAFAWTDQALAQFVVGATYLDSVAATAEYTAAPAYALATGALPDGIYLDAASGAFTGRPTVAGPYAFAVTATRNLESIVLQFSGVVAAAPVGPTISDPAQQRLATTGGGMSVAEPLLALSLLFSGGGLLWAVARRRARIHLPINR